MRVKRDLKYFTRKEYSQIVDWLNGTAVSQRTTCPFGGFIPIRICIQLCGHMFPGIKNSLWGDAPACPCLRYEHSYVRQVARQVVKSEAPDLVKYIN